ncbi:XTP/dITP diphosphatase [Allofustis seminis]|uniref:XTP/dITP diphosphatase n=1 Tax=Allofustis seminis TaxID=166939 RepID=UPI00035F0AD1|nr:XTP/dITP diphosphatase [Allofustis seminis]
MEKEIVIATHNKGKAREFHDLFKALGYKIKTLKDFPMLPAIEETGTTFEENALLKAQTVAHALNIPVLADDSGLAVEYLNGAPGVYSARYAGIDGNDRKNNQKLLEALKGVPSEERGAKFLCTLALVKQNEAPIIVTGEVEGVILTEPQGENGFGYDPLFYIPALGKSFAEISIEEKNKLSHRANAIKKLRQQLPNWLKEE